MLAAVDSHVVPQVTRIVYSTCSVHAQENEHVVEAALRSDEASGTFTLGLAGDVLPAWGRRGLETEMSQPGQQA